MFEKNCNTIVSITGICLLPYFYHNLHSLLGKGVGKVTTYLYIFCAFSHWIFISLPKWTRNKVVCLVLKVTYMYEP